MQFLYKPLKIKGRQGGSHWSLWWSLPRDTCLEIAPLFNFGFVCTTLVLRLLGIFLKSPESEVMRKSLSVLNLLSYLYYVVLLGSPNKVLYREVSP